MVKMKYFLTYFLQSVDPDKYQDLLKPLHKILNKVKLITKIKFLKALKNLNLFNFQIK